MPVMLPRIRKAWRSYNRLTGLPRELATLGLLLAASLVVLPPLIWLAGSYFLGDYARSPAGSPTGGMLALWIDFLRGLGSGSLGYWIALLGPYVMLKWLQLSGPLLRK